MKLIVTVSDLKGYGLLDFFVKSNTDFKDDEILVIDEDDIEDEYLFEQIMRKYLADIDRYNE